MSSLVMLSAGILLFCAINLHEHKAFSMEVVIPFKREVPINSGKSTSQRPTERIRVEIDEDEATFMTKVRNALLEEKLACERFFFNEGLAAVEVDEIITMTVQVEKRPKPPSEVSTVVLLGPVGEKTLLAENGKATISAAVHWKPIEDDAENPETPCTIHVAFTISVKKLKESLDSHLSEVHTPSAQRGYAKKVYIPQEWTLTDASTITVMGTKETSNHSVLITITLGEPQSGSGGSTTIFTPLRAPSSTSNDADLNARLPRTSFTFYGPEKMEEQAKATKAKLEGFLEKYHEGKKLSYEFAVKPAKPKPSDREETSIF